MTLCAHPNTQALSSPQGIECRVFSVYLETLKDAESIWGAIRLATCRSDHPSHVMHGVYLALRPSSCFLGTPLSLSSCFLSCFRSSSSAFLSIPVPVHARQGRNLQDPRVDQLRPPLWSSDAIVVIGWSNSAQATPVVRLASRAWPHEDHLPGDPRCLSFDPRQAQRPHTLYPRPRGVCPTRVSPVACATRSTKGSGADSKQSPPTATKGSVPGGSIAAAPLRERSYIQPASNGLRIRPPA